MLLRKKGIGVQVHYIPIPSQPYYQSIGYKKDASKGKNFYHREISIPIYPSLKKFEVNMVIDTLKTILKKI